MTSNLADVLDRRRVDARCRSRAETARARRVVAEHADLDELVAEQIHVDLVQHRGRQAVVADHDDRVQMVRLGAQRAALSGVTGAFIGKYHRGRES